MGMHVSRTSRGVVVRSVSRGSETVRPRPRRGTSGGASGGSGSKAGTGGQGGTGGDFGADFE